MAVCCLALEGKGRSALEEFSKLFGARFDLRPHTPGNSSEKLNLDIDRCRDKS